jgi:hypothetical protein
MRRSSHNAAPNVMTLLGQHDDGQVEVSEDEMVITIGKTIDVRRP